MSSNNDKNSFLGGIPHDKYWKIGCLVKHYNPVKYWKMRSEVVNPNSKVPKLIRIYWYYKIKKTDAFNLSSTGTGFGSGAQIKSPPNFPHLLNGIIISRNCIIGDNCTIYQQVTIADGNDGGVNGAAIIGDNVLIGAGAKIIGKVRIGNNVKIGANAVVVNDIPDNCTVVGIPAKIVKCNGVKVN